MKDKIKDSIYNRMFEFLMKHGAADVIRAVNASSTAIKRDGVRITRGGSGMSEVTIPAEIDGQRVVRIDINAFKGNRRLKTVTVEANLKEVASGAFSKNTKLSQVIFKCSVEAFSRS